MDTTKPFHEMNDAEAVAAGLITITPVAPPPTTVWRANLDDDTVPFTTLALNLLAAELRDLGKAGASNIRQAVGVNGRGSVSFQFSVTREAYLALNWRETSPWHKIGDRPDGREHWAAFKSLSADYDHCSVSVTAAYSRDDVVAGSEHAL